MGSFFHEQQVLSVFSITGICIRREDILLLSHPKVIKKKKLKRYKQHFVSCLLHEQAQLSLCAVISQAHTHTPVTDAHADNFCTTCSFTNIGHTTDVILTDSQEHTHLTDGEHTVTHVQHFSQVLIKARMDHLGTREFMWVSGGREAQIFTLGDVPVQHLSWTMRGVGGGRGSEVCAAQPPLLFREVQADLGIAGAVALAGNPVPDGEVLRAALRLQLVHSWQLRPGAWTDADLPVSQNRQLCKVPLTAHGVPASDVLLLTAALRGPAPLAAHAKHVIHRHPQTHLQPVGNLQLPRRLRLI